MRKISIPLIVAVLFALLLGVSIAIRSESPSSASKVRADATVLLAEAVAYKDQATETVAEPEQQAPTEIAQQILTDVNNANVEDSTETLMTAFSRLGKLCNTAVQTSDAMLSVSFDGKTTEETSGEKGTENGDE